VGPAAREPRLRQIKRKEQKKMIRNLKALGLALVAVFAMSALAASAAQATPIFTGYETPSGTHVHTIGTGTTAAGSIEKFVAGAGTVECHITYETTSLTGEDTELTVKPTKFTTPGTTEDGHCNTLALGANFKTDIDFEGCDYIFHSGVKLAANEYTGTVDIKCPEGKSIDIKITNSTAGTKCTLRVPAQNGLKHVIYKNQKVEKPTDVNVEATVAEIKYQVVEGGVLGCGKANGTYEGANGSTYSGSVTLKGEDTVKNPLDIEVSGE
jgi:hypothetical protein